MADITVSAKLLERASKRNGYATPTDAIVFFGVRGLLPADVRDASFGKSREARFAPIDFRRMRCTIGQWRVATKDVALFPGSTVPSGSNVDRARTMGGNGTNLLMLGRHEYQIGDHKAGKPNGHRAFRQAMFQPVWRTADDTDYDLRDKLDIGSGPGDYVWDNIHCAYYDDPEAGYSSAGCQVVCGLPRSPARKMAEETGPWRAFVSSAYESGQKRFVYMLFAAEELALIANAPEADLRQVVRYGSSGDYAKAVQEALRNTGHLASEADGEFGRNSLIALVKFQGARIGPGKADGVCGAETAAALGLTPPLAASAGAAPDPASLKSEPTTGRREISDDSDFEPDVLDAIKAALGRMGRTTTLSAPTVGTAAATPTEELATANFERCQQIVKAYEGGFVNDPKDPGGATNFGITIKVLSAHRGRRVSPAEVAGMSYDEAKEIYAANYWAKTSCGQMPGPLALAVYNCAVHAGPATAARFLQRALNQNGAAVKIDGGVGGETLGALKSAPLADVVDDVIDFYEAKLRAHKHFAHFGKGFMRRVARLRTETERWLNELGDATTALPTPKLPDEEGDAVTEEKLADGLAVLRALLAAAQTKTADPVAAPTSPGPDTALVDLLRSVLAPAVRPPVVLPPNSAAATELTPVNGALGRWLGKLLDGRKSAFGIVGALASSLFTQVGQVDPATVGSAVAPVLNILTGASPTTLPIFLALSAWGLLGKLDKYARAVNINRAAQPDLDPGK